MVSHFLWSGISIILKWMFAWISFISSSPSTWTSSSFFLWEWNKCFRILLGPTGTPVVYSVIPSITTPWARSISTENINIYLSHKIQVWHEHPSRPNPSIVIFYANLEWKLLPTYMRHEFENLCRQNSNSIITISKIDKTNSKSSAD